MDLFVKQNPKMKNKKGIGLIVCGLLLLAASFALIIYNIEVQKNAGIISNMILEQMTPTGIADFVFNETSDLEDPNMDMPEKEVNGLYYIATLSVPALNLNLPVNTKWNYSNLKKSPCRYSGSAYTDNLIICAHNYNIHFGKIKYLHVGDSVILTDMDGRVFRYEVTEMESLEPYAAEQMKSGDWDLTLFTCTVGGGARVTVRCKGK